ncbi:syndecan isoform X2 [Frankliniella occidentalis]|uniref:Syndecan n=1 Tax=Frankliniella occidentalis TaxID=133901 RepID=A0A6J1SWQ3_FRAOC|nr:syndecan isoform X2 [Frankliniella occidentalis]
MHFRISPLLLAALLVGYTAAQEARSTSASTPSWKLKDEIYLDDAADGSGDGPRGDFKGDLEASGSGGGPAGEDDDEDYARKGSDVTHKGSPDVDLTERNRLDETTRTQTNVENAPVYPEQDLSGSSSNANSNSNSNQDLTLSGGTGGTRVQTEVEENGLGPEDERTGNEGVYIMSQKPEERAASFFAQPGILAAVIGGAVVGLLCAILVVMFIVYRMRKKDEGSYALDEPKRSPTVNSYSKNTNREFFA